MPFWMRYMLLGWRSSLSIALALALLVFLLGSFLFTASSLRETQLLTLRNAPDLTVELLRGGRHTPIPMSWAEDIAQIPGVVEVRERVYGYYPFEAAGSVFTLMGVDPFLPGSDLRAEKMLEGVDLRGFFEEPSLIAGTGVIEEMRRMYYFDSFSFILPDGSLMPVRIAGTINPPLAHQSHSLILIPTPLAREILDLPLPLATDLARTVPNEEEFWSIARTIRELHPHTRVLTRTYLKEQYEALYDTQSGVLLALFLCAPSGLVLLVWNQASSLTGTQRREIATFRAIGWSVKDLLLLKLKGSALVLGAGFLMGWCAAWVFVHLLGAPGIRQIFLGEANLPHTLPLEPHTEPVLLVSLVGALLLPLLAASLYPAWRAAITDPQEALR